MGKKGLEKDNLLDKKKIQLGMKKVLDGICESDYLPTPLATREQHIERNKRLLVNKSQKDFYRGFPGIIEFSVLNTGSERIDNLLQKVLRPDFSQFDDKTPEEIQQMLAEVNMFGLTEADFDLMVQKSDEIYNSGKFELAIELYQALIVLFPLQMEGWIKWGNAEYHNTTPQAAIKVFEECLERFNHPKVHFCLGLCKVKLDQFNEAIIDFEKALALCDQFGDEEELRNDILSMYNDVKALKV